MPVKLYILSFLFLLSVQVFAQHYIKVSGKVAEVTNGVPTGMPGITVTAVGEDYAVTGEDGSFVLNLPSNKESVTIVLENCPHPMIDPPKGLVLIPPSGFLDIRVCGKNNRVLREKVAQLEGEIAEAGKKYKLSQRQLLDMHACMLDTIIYFQKNIGELDQAILRLKQDSTNNASEISRLLKKVEDLNSTNQAQEKQIKQLLLDRYLLQQKEFEEISMELKTYLSAVRDVQKQLLRYAPECALDMRPAPCNYFYELNQKYSTAWKNINLNFESRINAVDELWSNEMLTSQMNDVYHFILNDIHKNLFFEKYNNSIVEPMGNGASRNKIKKASEVFLENLAPVANDLENKINPLLSNFKNNS